MATVDELVLKLRSEYDKRGMDVAEDDLRKFVEQTKVADKETQRLSQSFDRKTKALNNVRDGIVRSSVAFASFNSTLGQVSGQVLQVADQFENMQYAAKNTGSNINLMTASMSQAKGAIGGLGVVGLALAAAMAGWKIGRAIAEFTGLDKAVDGATKRMLGFGSATDQADNALAKALNRAAQAGIALKNLSEFIKSANVNFQAAFEASQMEPKERLEAIQGRLKEIIAITADAEKQKQKLSAETSQKLQIEYNKLKQEELSLRKTVAEAALREARRLAEEEKRLLAEGSRLVEQQYQDRVDSIVASYRTMQEAAKQQAENEDAARETVARYAVTMRDAAIASLGFSQSTKDVIAKLKEEQRAVEETYRKLTMIAQILMSVGGASGIVGSTLMSGIQAFKQFRTDGLDKTHAAIGAVGASLMGLGNQIGGTAGEILNAAGAIAQGFAMGGPWGAAIAAIGVMFNALLKLFGHDWDKDVRNLINMWQGFAGISEGLQKQIAELAKELDDAGSAMFMSLSAVADEIGITKDNFQSYFQAIMYGFEAVNKGFLTHQQLAEGLNAILPQLTEAAMEFGGVYLDQWEQIIQAAKDAGVEIQGVAEIITNKIKELQQALMEQIDILATNLEPVLADLERRVDEFWSNIFKQQNPNLFGGPSGGTPTGGATTGGPVPYEELQKLKEQAQGFAAIIASAINAAVMAGASISEAVAKFAPELERMREIVKSLGLTMGEVGLGWLNQIDQINKKFPEQVGLINAVTSSLQAMLAAGIAPGKAGFESMQQSALDAFDKINADGKVSKAELATIKPLLMALAAASLQYGYALDPATIALLKQAGLWDEVAGKPDATKVQQKGIGDLVDALMKEPDGLIPTLQRFIDMLMELNGTTVETTVNTNYTDNKEGGNWGDKGKTWGGGSDTRRYDDLAAPITFTRTQHIIVDPGEKLSPKGWSCEIVFQNGAIQINGTGMNSQQVAEAVIQQIRKGALSNLRR